MASLNWRSWLYLFYTVPSYLSPYGKCQSMWCSTAHLGCKKNTQVCTDTPSNFSNKSLVPPTAYSPPLFCLTPMISRALSDVTLFCLLREKFPLRTCSNWIASLQSGCTTGACSCSDYWPSHWLRVRHESIFSLSDQLWNSCHVLEWQMCILTQDPSQRLEVGNGDYSQVRKETLSLKKLLQICLISLKLFTVSVKCPTCVG